MTKTKECADGILKDENPRMRAWFGSMDTVMYNASGQILQGTIQLLLVLSVGIFSALAGTKLLSTMFGEFLHNHLGRDNVTDVQMDGLRDR